MKSGGSIGIHALSPSTGALSLTVTSSTPHASGGYGVYAYAQNSGTQSAVAIKNSIITQHTRYGIYRYTAGSRARAPRPAPAAKAAEAAAARAAG